MRFFKSLVAAALIKLGLAATATRYHRRLYELFGSDRYSRPALNGIDHKLGKYLSYHEGFFVEAGANDGFTQSNTYYLERFWKWKGILVEPVPELYEKCVRERPGSLVINCALVASDYGKPDVTMTYANLMSLVRGARQTREADDAHVRRALEVQPDVEAYELTVPARSLTSILDEARVEVIDFLSLDVEGYELEVLKGLDLARYCPKYMLIETSSRKELDAFLAEDYEVVEVFSHHDVLYRRKQ